MAQPAPQTSVMRAAPPVAHGGAVLCPALAVPRPEHLAHVRRRTVARAEGKPYKLISRATVNASGSVTASVRPEQTALTDPLGAVRGTSLAIHFELDTIPGLTIVSHRPNLQSTAYGLLADFVNACD